MMNRGNDARQLHLKDEVFQVVGAAMTVLNELGPGLLEKPYENALLVELGLKDISVSQQERFEVLYKGVKVGEYIPDLIAFDELIVEIKAIAGIGDLEMAQMLNYLKICKKQVGLIINFKHAKLEWKRIVL